MKPAGDWLALAGTSKVAGGTVATLSSSPPPQAASTAAATTAARSVFLMTISSLRARQRRAEVWEDRQQRPVRLHLRAGLVDAVVQPERRRAERRRARLAGGTELVGVAVAVGDAEAPHHRDQRDVDDVVVRPASVR